jgi:hypothetical protein
MLRPSLRLAVETVGCIADPLAAQQLLPPRHYLDDGGEPGLYGFTADAFTARTGFRSICRQLPHCLSFSAEQTTRQGGIELATESSVNDRIESWARSILCAVIIDPRP